MCAPSQEARKNVITIITDALPKVGAPCEPTPEGVVAWIKLNEPGAWQQVSDELSPFCTDCEYRLVRCTEAIINQMTTLDTNTFGLVTVASVLPDITPADDSVAQLRELLLAAA